MCHPRTFVCYYYYRIAAASMSVHEWVRGHDQFGDYGLVSAQLFWTGGWSNCFRSPDNCSRRGPRTWTHTRTSSIAHRRPRGFSTIIYAMTCERMQRLSRVLNLCFDLIFLVLNAVFIKKVGRRRKRKKSCLMKKKTILLHHFSFRLKNCALLGAIQDV